MRKAYLIFILVIIASLQNALAQDSKADSASILDGGTPRRDSTLKMKFQPDAKRAGLLSALMPGLGQIYNRQYWKVPIVYAAMGTTIYMIAKNSHDYNRYRHAYVSRLANPNSIDEFSGILNLAGVKQYQDEAKRNMDMMVVYTVALYAGQIMEAIAGAHLKNFDISKDLSMQFRPVIMPNYILGVGLAVNFKR
jgi:hypothetical protein